MLSTAFTLDVSALINYDTPDSKYFPYISIHNQHGEDCWLHSLCVISNYIYGNRYTELELLNKLKNNGSNYTYEIKVTPEFVKFITTSYASSDFLTSPDEFKDKFFNHTNEFFYGTNTNMTNVTSISEDDVNSGNGPTFIYWKNFTEDNGGDLFCYYAEFNELTNGEYILGPSMAAMFNPYSQPLAIYSLDGPDAVRNDSMMWFGGHAIPSYIQIGSGDEVNDWLDANPGKDVFDLYVKLWKKDPEVATLQGNVYYSKSRFMNPVVNSTTGEYVLVKNPYLINAANNGLLDKNDTNNTNIDSFASDHLDGNDSPHSNFGLSKTGFPLIFLIAIIGLISGGLYKRRR
ncbi:MAG: hypothetical protein LBR15_09530 [Methanobrevibacter sp.]|jgi:hypothetical protein|nr:hypothetical protein [Candidatus Methanovirga australis]